MITLYVRQRKRHRCIEQSFGLCRRGRGWGWFGRIALKHVWYHIWNELLVQVWCMILDAWGWCTEMTQRDGTGRETGGGFRMGNTCIPVVDLCWCMANPIQYCKVKKKFFFNFLKVGLKLNIQKTKVMASGPISSWQIDGETMRDFILRAPKLLQMVIAAMKLKDACSLEEKLWST